VPPRKDMSPPRRADDVPPRKGMSPPRRGNDASPSESQEKCGRSRSQSEETQRMNEATIAQSTSLPRNEGGNQPQNDDNAGQEVIYRGKRGEKITKAEWLQLHEKKKKKHRKQEAPVLEWGGGLVQKEDRAKRLEEEARLMAEPVARYDIDPSLDEELRNRERWGDPFSQLANGVGETAAADPSKQQHANRRPKCRFPAPLNRFGILPGYRWDGVVRGNGFEDRLLSEKNRRKLEETESYKWSIEDI